MPEQENGNGNGTNGRFLKVATSIIGVLISALFAILGYLYLAQNAEIESLRKDFNEYKREMDRYKIEHEADKSKIIIELNRDIERIKVKLELDGKSTSRK